ncbi:hypothetical protein [Dyella sp. GSA-30]|uniref:hypothetical protein n=1 Tax=Dyella sp. GSA-30 TaxID=2994496 RepID=UPI002491D1C0|nr:hypothetical protein [Dyella sp. GSA-30]BDU23157.1 hypothetical protein DYGSA30_46140 [Dyella sp. GSA-30]
MTDVAIASLNDDPATWRAMNFRAVFAGWLVATGVAALLYLAGLAMGFSSFDADHMGGAAKAVGIGSGIWIVLVWAASLFVGGLFTSWFDAHDDQTIGSLHGVAVWGLSVTASMLWLALGLAGAMHAHNGMSMGHDEHGPMQGGTDTHAALMGDGSVAVLDANIASRLPASRDHGATMPIVAALLAGKDETAASLFSANAGVTHAAAAQTLAGLSAETNAARADAKSTADRTAHNLAAGLWALVCGLLIGLVTAAVGGWLGAGHVHRVYHLRAYPRALRR